MPERRRGEDRGRDIGTVIEGDACRDVVGAHQQGDQQGAQRHAEGQHGAKAHEPQTIEDEIRFCEIPAPSFKEDARTRGEFLALLKE